MIFTMKRIIPILLIFLYCISCDSKDSNFTDIECSFSITAMREEGNKRYGFPEFAKEIQVVSKCDSFKDVRYSFKPSDLKFKNNRWYVTLKNIHKGKNKITFYLIPKSKSENRVLVVANKKEFINSPYAIVYKPRTRCIDTNVSDSEICNFGVFKPINGLAKILIKPDVNHNLKVSVKYGDNTEEHTILKNQVNSLGLVLNKSQYRTGDKFTVIIMACNGTSPYKRTINIPINTGMCYIGKY